MKTANRIANLTAMGFYFAIHAVSIVCAIIGLLKHENTTAAVFATIAVLTYRPYRQAADRAQKSLGSEHNYTYNKERV